MSCAEIDAVTKEEEALAQAFNIEPVADSMPAAEECSSTVVLATSESGSQAEGSRVLGKREREEPELEEGEVAEDDAPTASPAALLSAGDENEDDETRRVTQEELRRLTTSAKLKAMLSSKELQRLIREVEAAPDRSAALGAATNAYPELQEFVDLMLKEIGPS